ncbi:MAG: NAD(P)/FAD-dependent oxidoreductase, partial [Erysipelotrichaceae bacterium]
MFDTVIIGAGVTGSSVAYYLSRYKLNILIVDKEEDICSGTSKANSAIIHAGHDAKNGSLKARFNVEGSKMISELSNKLGFSYRNNGALVLCFSKEDMPKLEELYVRGLKNGVEGLEIIDGDRARSLEPHLSKEVYAALYCPTSAIVCPFELTQALCENACHNGLKYRFNYKVETIEKKDGYYLINNEIKARSIINCAGVYADELHNMISDKKYHIIPKKGDYVLLDKNMGNYVNMTLFTLPTEKGKGVLVTPTVHGNLLVGPTSTVIDDKEGNNTTAEELNYVMDTAKKTCPELTYSQVITSFSGIRAHEENGDFVIQESEDGFFDCLGIESPGLSASVAIGKYIAELYEEKYHPVLNEDYKEDLKPMIRLNTLSMGERNRLIKENPSYGHIVCRCEEISEGEIVDALNRVPPAVSLDGIKRRTRAQMGRCQGGFCTPKIMEIMKREMKTAE